MNTKYVSIYCFPWIPWDLISWFLLLGLCSLKFRTYLAVVYFFLMLSFMFIQYLYSCASGCAIFIFLWFLCTWSKAHCWSDIGITIPLPLSTISSIPTSSSWNVQYSCMSCFTSTFIRGQPLIWCMLWVHVGAHNFVLHLILCVNMPSKMSVHISPALIISFMPGISWCLFPNWFCHGSQFAMQSSVLHLYMVCMLYWHMHSSTVLKSLWYCCYVIFEYGYQWFVLSDYVDFMGETVVMIFLNSYSMRMASPSMLLYLISAQDRLLLLKAMGHKAILFGSLLCRKLIPFLTCCNPALRQTPDSFLALFVVELHVCILVNNNFVFVVQFIICSVSHSFWFYWFKSFKWLTQLHNYWWLVFIIYW